MSVLLALKKIELLAEQAIRELEEEAPPYVEPGETEDPPILPPTGEPTPPGDTPTDPDTSEPEPGVDPDFTEATRIEVTGQKQTVIRTTADPGFWGNAYVAAELDGYDYWEIHIAANTPNNATLAVGVSNLDLPLNGIPGNEAESLAYWSSGVIRNSGTDTDGFPTFGRGDKISIARDKDNGRIWFAKNGVWLGSTPAVGGSGQQGTLTGAGPYYPFTALYSGGTSVTFKFASSKFAYSIPAGFYPIGQTPVTAPAQFGTGDWSVADAATSGDITITITALPDGGGSAITDLEYQIDGGSWVSLSGTTTGDYPVSGLTDDVAVAVAIRAVNAVGAGAASATKAVTPTAGGDPYWSSVVFIASFDGADGSTTLTDESPTTPHTMTATGNAQLDTAQKKFGTAAGLFDGTGDYFAADATSGDFALGTGQFTVEAWIRFNSLNTGGGAGDFICGVWVANFLSWVFRRSDSASELQFLTSSNGVGAADTITTSGAGLTTGVWHHVAVDRDASNKVRIYVDGVMRGSATGVTTDIRNSTSRFSVGAEYSTGGRCLNGWLDELRVTKGAARYASDSGFTVPSAAFPRS